MSASKKTEYIEKEVVFNGKKMKLYSIDGTTWSTRPEELKAILERHDEERATFGEIRGRLLKKDEYRRPKVAAKTEGGKPGPIAERPGPVLVPKRQPLPDKAELKKAKVAPVMALMEKQKKDKLKAPPAKPAAAKGKAVAGKTAKPKEQSKPTKVPVAAKKQASSVKPAPKRGKTTAAVKVAPKKRTTPAAVKKQTGRARAKKAA